MKRNLLLLLSALFITSCCFADTAQEKALLDRINTMIAQRDPSQIHSLKKSPPVSMEEAVMDENFAQLMMVQGVKEMKFIDIFPVIAAKAEKVVEKNGKKYVIDVKPYKMLEIDLKDANLKGTYNGGRAVLVGEAEDDRLWIAGLKEVKS